MAAHEGAVSGRTVLLALLFGVMVLSLVMCAYLLGRLVGGKDMSALAGISSLLVQTGVIPKEAAESLGSSGKLIGKSAKPAKPQRTKGHQNASAESLACPTEDPITEADSDDPSVLDPLAAYDRAAGRGNPALAAANAGDLAADGPVLVPTFVNARTTAAAVPAAPAAAAPGVAAAPGAAGAAAAAGAAPAAAPPAAAIPHLSVPAPEGAAALPPPTVYTVELGFFLSDQAAAEFAGELQKRGVAVNLVSETDPSGRNWTYVRSGHFTDSVQAFTYASDLAQNDNLPGQVVQEKAVATK
jgi:hypothetical protein